LSIINIRLEEIEKEKQNDEIKKKQDTDEIHYTSLNVEKEETIIEEKEDIEPVKNPPGEKIPMPSPPNSKENQYEIRLRKIMEYEIRGRTFKWWKKNTRKARKQRTKYFSEEWFQRRKEKDLFDRH
jgi:hypothetical protein